MSVVETIFLRMIPMNTASQRTKIEYFDFLRLLWHFFFWIFVVNWMSQDKLTLVKKFRLSPREASMLADKAQQANMTESEYLRLMISQKPNDYPEIRILLRELINEVNHIGININQIVHNYNSGMYSEDDKERLVAYMRKLNMEVNNVYKTVNEGKFGNE